MKMSGKHVTKNLSAYHHKELPMDEMARVETHLSECPKCRNAYEEIRFGARLASMLVTSQAPESIWNEIDASNRTAPRRRRWLAQFAGAGLAIVALLFLGVAVARYLPARPSWEVVGPDGMSVGRLRMGDVLETDASSQARVKIADIGDLTLDPNTRIRLLVTRPDEHRMALDRGKVEAVTVAPPRLFIVETPAATAIDLGCAYTLEVEDDGSSLLHVTAGLVALERDGRETIVPAGAFCRTSPGSGPGTPFYEDSSSNLQAALDYIDTGKNGPEYDRQLEIALRESRVRDALSLWFLIPRLDTQSRGLVFDRLAELLPPPPEVTRDGIMALDPAMLGAWEKIVAQLWH
jgi:ferric-dicitrate binding protein FerR (iron transport regulator)